MAQIIVRNLEESLERKLQRRAARHGCSLEEEIRQILTDAVRSKVKPRKGLPRKGLPRKGLPRKGLGTAIAERFKGIELEHPIEEFKGFDIEPPKFD